MHKAYVFKIIYNKLLILNYETTDFVVGVTVAMLENFIYYLYIVANIKSLDFGFVSGSSYVNALTEED